MRWLLLFAFVLLAGCPRDGGHAKHSERTIDTIHATEPVPLNKDGTPKELVPGVVYSEKLREVQQPDDPDESAAINWTDTGGSMTTGKSSKLDQALAQLSFLPWLGAALCLLGVLGFVASFKYPVVPKYAGPAVAALGLLFIIIPTYSWAIAIAFGLVGLVAAFVILRRQGFLQKMNRQNMAGIDNVLDMLDSEEEREQAKRRLMGAQDHDVQAAVKAGKTGKHWIV